MRNLHKLLSTGCFFLCLGGWVCSDQAFGEDAPDSGVQVKEAAMATAVAQAAATPTTPAASTAAPADAPAPAAAEAPATQPGDTAVAAADGAATDAGTGTSTNLNAPTVNIDVDGRVEEFNAQDLDITTALHFLSLESKRNIIASKDVRGNVTANLYNVTFTEALDALLKPNGFDYIEKGNFIYVYTEKELDDLRKRDRKTVNRIYRLHYMNAQDAAVLIKPLLSEKGVLALTPAAVGGLPEGTTDTGAMNYATDDTLVVNDYPENLNEVDHALHQLDVRPKQVLIESTILRASLNEDNALGIDFISLSGADFSSLSGAGFTSNVNGANAATGTTGTGGTGTGSSTGTPIFGPNGLFNNFLGNKTQTNVGTDFASQVPQGGMSVGFLSNNIGLYLRALEQITDTTVVANPKILALNKHKGEVFIGQEFGYKTTTVSQTTSTETIQFLDTGTKLIFRPFIGDDGYVRMEIHPEDSAGGLDSNSLPQKQSTEVTSNIMVKDGRTVVIGGLFRELTTAARGQVPILGNIPILGLPFRRTNDSTQRTETIVLMTPHIINDDTSLYDESEKQAEDVNRMMLGNRAGLQPWGRDRIAQLWYSKAQDELDKGHKKTALMYTDWALNTNPRFIEAIKLREQITSKRVREADESSCSTFVKDVLRDDASKVPDSGGSGHYPPPEPVTTQPASEAH
jgi:type IV pilus assembly protein PilQ